MATRDRGSALVIALMAAALLSVFGLALAVLSTTEMMVASSYATGQELLYAAESGLEIGERELARLPDWNTVLAGLSQSAWIHGDPAAAQMLEDGSAIRLDEATNLANCGKPTPCSSPEMTATTDGRPWGLNNPHWRLFAFGPFNHSYVAVWVADNPADNDADPLADGTAPTNPGAGIVALRSEAFGVGGAHKVLESTFHRVSGPVDIGRLSWAQVW